MVPQIINKLRTNLSISYHALNPPVGRVTMYDNITVSSLPKGAAAYAGYVNGAYNTWAALVADFEASGAKLLSIDVFGTGFAHCLDVENGDATNASVIPWYNRMKAQGVPCPVIYTSASNVQAVINEFMKAGITDRTKYLIWSAHYTFSEHICAPSVCGYPAADATQWSDAGPGGCDVSAMASYFFPWTLGQTTPPAPKPPTPPAPKPYPAPTPVAQDHSKFCGYFVPIVVDGKLILSYTVQCIQMDGTVHSTQTVDQADFEVTDLVPGWQYKIRVWANGSPIAPPHTELDITA